MDTPLSNLSLEHLPSSEDIPPVFTELFELHKYEDGYQEWKEISRWIKYEEAVEEAGNRWSKPHVSTPTLRGWMQLRAALKDGLVLVSLEAKDLDQITELVTTHLMSDCGLSEEVARQLKDLWTKKHRHQFEGPRKIEGNLSRVIKDLLVQKLESKATASGLRLPDSSQPNSRRPSFSFHHHHVEHAAGEHAAAVAAGRDDGKINVALQRKISGNAEAAVILEGVVNFLERPMSVLVRLAKPLVLRDLPEVDIPTRILFFYAGPPRSTSTASPSSTPSRFVLSPAAKAEDADKRLYADVGISLAMAITDRAFVASLYNAKSRQDILDALDVYTNELKVLPGDFNTEMNKIDPPVQKDKPKLDDDIDDIDEDRRMREESGLVRTGRLGGGLLADIRRKKPFYASDFLHGLHPQCISSFLFLYFACLAPIVAFGGLLGDATENRIATIESLMSGLISGVLFGLFAGQPLIILGSTGPVYVFEKILYQICTDQNWDYLSLRLWIGIWVGLILIALVILDASAYVCYITRFTEELFATLIAFIFIFNAFKNVISVGQKYQFAPEKDPFENDTFSISNDTFSTSNEDCLETNSTAEVTPGCLPPYEPNVFLMSLILFAGSFTIAFGLKNFKNTGYLPGNIRNFLSDFAVIIAIVSMTGISYYSGVNTPKLVVPDTFKPTWEGRDWVVTHALIFADHLLTNPWWVDVFLAPILATLATILIFMDQQITAVIVNRKEHKLKKGSGYHLDLMVLAIIIIVCSVFGLPWFVAATVLSINHIQSLRKESESSAPGEKPHFLGIREQRVTAILIAVAIGLSTFITPALALIPMPVLFGVFLFMGVSSLKGLQFFDRLRLLFIPHKYQPDYVFLKYVPISRVHLFTFFQLSALIILWLIKNNQTTSISFPVMLVLICALRKFLECIFTRRELKVLDDLLPESSSPTKRRHGGSIFNKIHGRGSRWDDEGENEAAAAEAERNRREAEALLYSVNRNRALGAELDEYSRVDIKAKAKNVQAVNKAAAAAVAAARNRSNSAVGFRDRGKVLIFVKMQDQEVYTPLNANARSVGGLLRRLEAKFPVSLKAASISNVYQKNRNNLVFHLDDDMVELIESNQVFDLELEESSTCIGKVDLTLVEVES